MYTTLPTMFDNLWSTLDILSNSPQTSWGEIFPPMSIFFNEEDGSTKLEFALAGYKKEELSFEVEGNTITLKGAPEELKTAEPKGRYYKNKRIKKLAFTRSYTLPTFDLDFEKAKATYIDGLLAITIPKKVEEKATKRIAIEG